MKLSVIGTGYLGAVHAACMAQLGFDVVGIDVDEQRISSLAAGVPPFYEPGFDDVLAKALASGRLTFTTDMAAAADCDVHFICVGTPQIENGIAADLTYVKRAFAEVAKVARFALFWFEEIVKRNSPEVNPYPFAAADAAEEMIGMIRQTWFEKPEQ